jgi:hypothetical protein
MKAMWTKYMHATKPVIYHRRKQANIKAKKIKNNPPPSAVGFTHSGHEAPLVQK